MRDLEKYSSSADRQQQPQQQQQRQQTKKSAASVGGCLCLCLRLFLLAFVFVLRCRHQRLLPIFAFCILLLPSAFSLLSAGHNLLLPLLLLLSLLVRIFWDRYFFFRTHTLSNQKGFNNPFWNIPSIPVTFWWKTSLRNLYIFNKIYYAYLFYVFNSFGM